MHNFILRRAGGLLLCALLVLTALCAPAAAANDTLTLTGEISGVYEVPDGVTRVILNGVTAADFESGVVLPGGAEVELADGTENVTGIYCQGDLHVTGGGALLGGPGIYAQGSLTLDLTGAVVLEGGMITAFGGDVTINSGTYRMQNLDDVGNGTIGAVGGNVYLNGGDVVVRSDVVGVTAGDGSIVVDRAEVDVSGEYGAMMAVHIELPEAARDSLEIKKTDGEVTGEVVAAGSGTAKRVQIRGSAASAELEKGDPVIVDGKTDAGSAVVLKARAEDAETVQPDVTGDADTDPFVWALVGLAVLLVILAGVYYLLKKKKDKNHKPSEKEKTK